MMSEEGFPMPKSAYMEAQKKQAKNRVVQIFDEYKELLADKTHPDNQTNAYNERVKKTLQRLLTAANDLDEVVPGEGIFGLIALSLRTNLKLKDENTILEKKLRDLEREVRRLQKQR